MNKKLSGGQLVIVPITRTGRNYFPVNEYLDRRYIKYIDYLSFLGSLPDTTDQPTNERENMYLTLVNEFGNTEFVKDQPLLRFDYLFNFGVRQTIGRKLSIRDCYIDNQNENAIGKYAAFVFWYDLEEYSRRNTTKITCVDSIVIPITNITRYNLLPNSDRMAGKRFRRIFFNLDGTLSPNQDPLVGQIASTGIFLTLRKGSYNVLQNIPIELFWQLNVLERQEFANIIFDFESSFITVGGAGITSNPGLYIGKSVMFNLEYEN